MHTRTQPTRPRTTPRTGACAVAMLALLCLALLQPRPAMSANFTASQNADMLLGSPGYASTQRGLNHQWGLDNPDDVHVDAAGHVYVADRHNHRIVVWDTPFASPPFPDNGQAPSFVIGNLSRTDYRYGCSSTRTREPRAISTGGGRMVVADEVSDRVLLYDTIPTADGAAASRVLGQSGLASCSTNNLPSQSNVNSPEAVWTDGTKVVVADSINNRVLIWNTWPTASNQNADIVLGQADFVSGGNDDVGGASASTLHRPEAVWSNGTKLLVADASNNRVLVWNSWPTANAQAANFVIGQGAMNTTGTSCSTTGLASPEAVSSNGTRIAIASLAQDRVLLYNAWPTANGPAAAVALGQTAGNSCSRNRGSTTIDAVGMEQPDGVWTDGTNILVADSDHHRVLGWTSWPAAHGTAATRVLGQSGFSGAAAQAHTGGNLVAQTWNRTPTDGLGQWLAINPLTQGLMMSNTRDSLLTYYTAPPTVIDQAPDWLIGQQANDQALCNGPTGGASQDRVCLPMGAWTDGTKLLVVDKDNDRVLVWNTFPVNAADTPDLVLGQATWTASSSSAGQSRLNSPTSVASDGTRIAVVDKENTRVMLWDAWPTVMGQAADRVLGQPDWTSTTSTRTQTGLDDPIDVDIWNGKLAVADRDGERVMIWNEWPTATFAEPADAVFGTTNFTTTGTLDNVRGVDMEANALFVTDDDCAMVLDPIPTSGATAETAASTIGTCTAGSTDVNPSQSALENPSDIAAFAGRVWVANMGHGRVMRWTDGVTPTVTVAPTSTSTCMGQQFVWSTSESGTSEVYWGPSSQAAYTGYPNSSIDSSHTGLTHTHTVPNIPAGTYYYRVRTVDWRGQAVVSSEGTFVAPAALPGPTAQFSHDTDAQLGTTNNASLVNPTPWLSWANNTPCNVDRQRTQVVTTPLDGVVGLWHFDGNGTDVSPSGNTSVLQAPPADPSYVAGGPSSSFGQVLDLDGDDLTRPAISTALDLNVMTVEAWFRTTDIAGNREIVVKDAGSPYRENYILGFWGGNLTWENSADGGTIYNSVGVPGAAYADGRWHHVAGTASNGGTMRLYVDGVPVGATPAVSGSIDVTTGGPSVKFGRFFVGQIDEVRISNVVRSAADIAGYYRTRYPHYHSMFDSDPTDAGASQAACAQATRCANVGHGATGTSTPLGGGRYHARQKVRVAGGMWSAWSTYDWLETRLGRPVNSYVGDTSAATGAVNPTGISSNTPRLSWQNTAGAAIDRQQTQVATTPLDDVVALWHLDAAGGTDASGNGRTASSVTGTPSYVVGATNFGNALSLDGASRISTAYDPSLDLDTWSVDAWFRVNGLPANSWPTILAKESATLGNYRVYIDRAANVVTFHYTAGGTDYYACNVGSVPSAAPYEDDRWHHVALTSDGASVVLYLDGIQQCSRTIVGTIDKPAVGATVGGTGNGAGENWNGMLDDVRISRVARSAAEIAGYYATKRPHYDAMWDSGEQVVAPCADLVRCSDVTYAGSPLVRAGARYYARSRVRAAGGTWSYWSDWDWFETTPSITIALPTGAAASLGSAAPGSDAAVAHDVEVTSSNAIGYTLSATGPSDTWGMTDGSAPHVPRWSGAPGTPTAWAAGTSGGFGLTVLSATGGKDTARWGTGATATDYATNKYVGLMSGTSSLLHATSAAGATDTIRLGLRANVDATVPPGPYSATVSLTAVANP